MGRRKTKFEVSLGEVSFKNITIKFETDQNDEPDVLESVRDALGNIIGTPTRLLMLEATGRPGGQSFLPHLRASPRSLPHRPEHVAAVGP